MVSLANEEARSLSIYFALPNTVQFWIRFHHPKTFLIETFNILQHLGGFGTKYFIFRHAETFPKKILKNM
jgi:hypothetical protein